MRRNSYTLFAFFTIIVLLQPFFPHSKVALAGAPRLGECRDPQNRVVRTEYDTNLRVYAKVLVSPASGNRSPYTIQVNPTHYYLSRETQQWLFYRQCGRINLKQRSIQQPNVRISVHEETAADCWAIRYMVNEKRLITTRNIDRINRDIEMLERDSNRWRAIFGARRSRVSTMECLYNKNK
jgi:hypothetical protein